MTNSWRDVNDEVVKSLTHFEVRLSELLDSWNESEQLVEQAARSDHLMLRAEIKVCLDNAQSVRGVRTKDVLRKYHLMENQLVGEILECRVGRDVDAAGAGAGAGEDGSGERDGSITQHLPAHSHATHTTFTSEEQSHDAVSVMSPSSKNASGNLFNMGGEGSEESNLILLKRIVRKAAAEAHSALEAELLNLTPIIKRNRKNR